MNDYFFVVPECNKYKPHDNSYKRLSRLFVMYIDYVFMLKAHVTQLVLLVKHLCSTVIIFYSVLPRHSRTDTMSRTSRLLTIIMHYDNLGFSDNRWGSAISSDQSPMQCII